MEGAAASRQSDLYSLGKLIDEIAAGGLAGLVAWLTESDPARRPRSAREALDNLDADATRPLPQPQHLARPTRSSQAARGSRPTRAALAVAAVLLVALALFFSMAGDDDDSSGDGTPQRTVRSLDGRFDQLEELIRTSTK